jgi:hypothetical protein
MRTCTAEAHPNPARSDEDQGVEGILWVFRERGNDVQDLLLAFRAIFSRYYKKR